MTTHTPQNQLDPMLEALINEILQTGSTSKTVSQEEEEVMSSMAESLKDVLIETMAQASPVEKVLLVEALAPALADALAPTIAQALTPAITAALSNMVVSKQAIEGSAASKSTGKREK